ncbi:MAG: hypothetical protein EOM66_06065 [Clostridia bacterium]|nr:hypothetical protein [Candidatus Pelethousia sp.]NCB30958.1 hypothetical protein [Clostridia bacterium]
MNGLHPYGSLRASTALLLCCAMLLLGAAGGYSLRGVERVEIEAPPEEAAQPQETEALRAKESPAVPDAAAQVSQMGEDTVSPDATVIWRYQMACGHTVELEDAQPVIGKTRAELAQTYGVDAVESFSPQAVTLCVASDKFCPQHFVLKLENGALTVRKTNEQLTEEILLTLDLELPADAAVECEAGLAFDSMEDINVYLEGLDS